VRLALVAEVVKYYYPNLVDLHNYPPAQSLNNKTANWNVLNRLLWLLCFTVLVLSDRYNFSL